MLDTLKQSCDAYASACDEIKEDYTQCLQKRDAAQEETKKKKTRYQKAFKEWDECEAKAADNVLATQKLELKNEARIQAEKEYRDAVAACNVAEEEYNAHMTDNLNRFQTLENERIQNTVVRLSGLFSQWRDVCNSVSLHSILLIVTPSAPQRNSSIRC